MTKQESPFFVGQQAQITETLDRRIDDPERPGVAHARIRVFEDRITPVVIDKVARKYVYVVTPEEKRGRFDGIGFDGIGFDKFTGQQNGDFARCVRLETPEMYRERKAIEQARQFALEKVRAITGTGRERRAFEEAVGVHQYEAIALALGEFRLTPQQADLLDQIWQRLTADEQQVWETLLDYLPNEMRDSA